MQVKDKNIQLMKYFSIISIVLMLTLAAPVTQLSYGGAEVEECVEPPAGMVSWWPLDETSGTNAEDIIGGNDGEHNNGPTFATGNVGDALEFDGVDQYVDAGSDSSLDITGPITIDAWIKPNTIEEFQDIVAKGDLDDAPGALTYFLLIMKDAVPDGTIRFGINVGGVGDFVDSDIQIAKDVFTHVAATFDAGVTGDVVIYINGVEKGTGNIAGTPPSNDEPLFIGALKNGAGTANPFSGVIDEVEIF